LLRLISRATIPEWIVSDDVGGIDMQPAKDQDGSDTTPAEEQNAAKAKPRWSLPSDLLKVSALGGALLYGILFLGYYTYYGRLGLRPEDLGVSYTFILVRSIGFIAIMGTMLGILSIIYLIGRQFKPGPTTRGDMVRYITAGPLGVIFVVYLIFISPSSWPSWVALLVFLAALLFTFLALYLTDKHRTIGLTSFAVLALLATVVLPTTAIVARANNLASQVLAGNSITPYELFGVPILDVSASTVTVDWIGPANQRPAIFGSKSPESVHGLLLGTEAGTAQAGTVVLLIRYNDQPDIVQIPGNLVTVESS
jgi:hypothetical protein